MSRRVGQTAQFDSERYYFIETINHVRVGVYEYNTCVLLF